MPVSVATNTRYSSAPMACGRPSTRSPPLPRPTAVGAQRTITGRWTVPFVMLLGV